MRRENWGAIYGVAAVTDDGQIGEPFIPNKLVDKYFPTK